MLDYKLTEGSELVYCDAPTIASTLRTQYNMGFDEMPIILMSTNEIKINQYRKDYTSHDLFDYAISKERALEDPEYFRNKCISFLRAYKDIKKFKFDLNKILANDSESRIISPKLKVQIETSGETAYEYSRFIFEHIIRSSGPLIGEDILSARLGVCKLSLDWDKLKSQIISCKYSGVFSDVYERWWMDDVNLWWNKINTMNLSLRHFDAKERVDYIKKSTKLENLQEVSSSEMNHSKNYWTICHETLLPLDPFDGIELLEGDIKPWQDKRYVSIQGALNNIEKYSKVISESDRIMLREFNS